MMKLIFLLLCLVAIIARAEEGISDLTEVVDSQGDDDSTVYDLCGLENKELKKVPEILSYDDLIHLRMKTRMTQDCEMDALEQRCLIDYSDMKTDMMEVCREHKAVFVERHHRLVCSTMQRTFIMTVHNLPMCMGRSCSEASVDQIIQKLVQALKEDAMASLEGAQCSVEYDIEDPRDVRKCPQSLNARPLTCGPLQDKTKGFLCDCYSFCDGELIACQDEVTPEVITCPNGDLVAGCTYELFDAYNLLVSSIGNRILPLFWPTFLVAVAVSMLLSNGVF